MAITDIARFGVDPTLERAHELCQRAMPGSVMLQLRDRALPVRSRLELGERLLELARASEQLLLVNDRLDLAKLLGADGVHLGEGSVSASDARQLLGDRVFVSRACHELEQLEAPELGPVDAVVLSPVFAPRKGRPALGIEVLVEAKTRLVRSRPTAQLFALGGVEAWVAGELRDSEVGLAAIGAVFEADPEALVSALGIHR